MTRFVLNACVFVVLCAGAAYMLLPGYHRAATPTWFGMTRVAPGLFTDASARQEELAALVTDARDRSSVAFGTPSRPSRVLVCTTERCAARFGIRTSGLAIGARTILIAPKGINATILTHEQVHIDLRRHMSLRDVLYPRFPAWFDEGLAALVSDDTRLDRMDVPEARFILDARLRRDWSRMTTADTWPRTYGAARTLVADLVQRLGPDGLRALIAEVGTTGDFAAALATRLPPDWP
ncbi:hypothetical protein [Pseudaestuariivita atlantica]|uniref:Peptidase MA-like domain-containing protein n=1 Tax=Pseudaestuariivita atlantica TaxID=1317121 RepID=A0A0L1JQP8_9RHOB|nr:hypothetical protein [Pseudaestuariivita atlantica]KNG94061.1 hypothetical protein ATO11_07370 [Pseudaestuariivita atlantica]